jgi:RNA polymerase sigma-70 factor (ECF subfamily)
MSAVTSAAPPPRGVMQQELVERARRGDHDAFAELAGAALFRLDAAARLILRDPDQAKDAVQETLVRAWRDLPTLRSPDRFDAWLPGCSTAPVSMRRAGSGGIGSMSN